MRVSSKKSAIGGSVVAIAILVLLLVSTYLYFDNSLTQSKSAQSSTVQDLQKSIGALQNRNSQLERQLASASGSAANVSIIGIDPVRIFSSAYRSVVTIQGAKVTTVVDPFFGPKNTVESIIGSGFVVNYSSSPYVVTNFHVVDGIVNATVTFWNGDSYRASVVGTDPYSDLAVTTLKAPASEFHPLDIVQSSSLQVGQPVTAIGNPFGLSGSMTFGIISQLGRTISENTAGGFAIADLIQFSAPINPGNSGGPLLDAGGSVIGITTAVVGGSQGVGFAIPSNTVLRELPLLISTGKYGGHPYLGIKSVDMSYDLALITKSNVTYGVLVQEVVKDGPADKAGLRAGSRVVQIGGQQYLIGGDIIVSINSTRIVNSDVLSTYLEEHAVAGNTIQVGLVRNGTFMTVSLILGARPPPSG